MGAEHSVFVGNLQFEATEDDIREAFEGAGLEVKSVRVVRDAENRNKSKGFGFVTLFDATSVDKAIERMNGVAIRGRNIRVDEARAKARA